MMTQTQTSQETVPQPQQGSQQGSQQVSQQAGPQSGPAPVIHVNVHNANTQHQHAPRVMYVKPRKSVGLAFLLTFLFGPLGMLYSTVGGAIVMLIVSVVVGVLTLGLGVVITWPICIIWGCVAAASK